MTTWGDVPMRTISILFIVVAALFSPMACQATDFSALFAQNTNSVVTIKSGNNLGTGFYVTPNLIVTNFHVIRNARDVSFSTTYKAGFINVQHVVAIDRPHDLAILYATKPGPPVRLAHSTSLVPGMELMSIGSPQGYEKTFAAGNFSQMRQSGLMQITIAVSPGSSGSPVFNTNGQVVGVVVSQRKDAQSLNFAVPAEFVIELVQKAQAIPREDYTELATMRFESGTAGHAENPASIQQDYSNIDTKRNGCRKFSSIYYESPKRGPIKQCVCNDTVVYTNIICQCPACTK